MANTPSALELLQQAAGAANTGGTETPAEAPAVETPATEAVAETPVEAAPEAAATPETPEAATTTEVAPKAATAIGKAMTMADMFGALTNSSSASDLANSMGGEGGVRFAQPFAQLRKGNWTCNEKHCPDDVYEFMPVGSRAFRGIFLGYRIGMLGWGGGSTADSGGNPPMWAAACPHQAVHEAGGALTAKALQIGGRIQFTKRDARVKFDAAGRLTPEIHLHVWTPRTGFIVLTVSGHNSVEPTLEALGKVEGHYLRPLTINVGESVSKNPKAKNPDAREWTTYYIDLAVDSSEKGQEIFNDFRAITERDEAGLTEACSQFLLGTDYDGLDVDALAAKLAEYDSIH